MTAPVPYAAVLLNLGAPDDEEDIHRYIQRLLSDSQVMPLPWPMRSLAARLIAGRRAAVAT